MQIVLVVPLLKGLLEVEAMVSTHDTGFVFPGQNTEIKVETFNFTRCGLPFGAPLGLIGRLGQQQSALPIAPCGPSQPSASLH